MKWKVVILVWIVACASVLTHAQGEKQETATSQGGEISPEKSGQSSAWFFMMGSANSHIRLQNASKLIDQQINGPLQILAPGMGDVRTFADQRDDFMIWTPFFAIGYDFASKWDAFVQAGYSAGKVVTRQTEPSLLLIPIHSDVEFKRSNFFAGVGATFYPWGKSIEKKPESISDAFRNARPYVGSVLNWNHLTFDADAKIGVPVLRPTLKISQSDTWDIWSVGPYIGVDIPVSDKSRFSANFTYNHFFESGDDFSGPSLSLSIKRRF